MKYRINEIYRSRQGEGVRSGTLNVFVRFTGCNMRCSMEPGPLSPGGFDCDTEFESGVTLTLDELLERIAEEAGDDCPWLILTGGEPALQTTPDLIDALHDAGYFVAIETNGSKEVPESIDWISVSPKVAEHAIRQRTANEVKYVRGYGQALPKTVVVADHYLISPAFTGNIVERRVFDWCSQLCEGTKWTLSLQRHKIENIR